MRQILITGGAGGIGSGIARAFLAAGDAVTVTGVSAAECATVVPAERLTTVELDVTDDASVARCLARFTELDALVNCAGLILRGGAEYRIEAFRRVVEVNLTGTMRMCVAAEPLLRASRGAIVNTASMLSFFGGPLVPAYTASKGAVVQLTKALAVAWAPDIRVNAVAPGWIDTPLTKGLVEDPSRAGPILARTPAGRWGEPDDIGGAVMFLCSAGAGFITGTVLPVDGGYLAS